MGEGGRGLLFDHTLLDLIVPPFQIGNDRLEWEELEDSDDQDPEELAEVRNLSPGVLLLPFVYLALCLRLWFSFPCVKAVLDIDGTIP